MAFRDVVLIPMFMIEENCIGISCENITNNLKREYNLKKTKYFFLLLSKGEGCKVNQRFTFKLFFGNPGQANFQVRPLLVSAGLDDGL